LGLYERIDCGLGERDDRNKNIGVKAIMAKFGSWDEMRLSARDVGLMLGAVEVPSRDTYSGYVRKGIIHSGGWLI
jgi:hypothetical protein